MYRVAAAVPSAWMVYRSSCQRLLMRTLGTVGFIHVGGVGDVVGDGDLGGVVFAGGGVGNDVAGRPFVVLGVFCRVQFEWGSDGGQSWHFVCGATLVSTRCFGLQASGAPTWVASALAAWRRAVVLVTRGGCLAGG